MSIKRLQQSYAFNFLSLCGIVNLIIFTVLTVSILIVMIRFNDSAFGIGIIFILHLIALIDIIIFLFAFLFAVIEYIFAIKIKNKILIESKIVKKFQIIGLIFFLLPIIFDLSLFWKEYFNFIYEYFRYNFF